MDTHLLKCQERRQISMIEWMQKWLLGALNPACHHMMNLNVRACLGFTKERPRL